MRQGRDGVTREPAIAGEQRFEAEGLARFLPHQDLIRLPRAPHFWNVGYVGIAPAATHIAGWCLPHDGIPGASVLRVNGIGHALAPGRPRGHYAEIYPWHPNAALSAFHLVIPHATQDLRAAGEFSLDAVPATGEPQGDRYTLDLLAADLSFKLPPADVATRIGAANLLQFVMYGRAIFRGFERVLARCFGTSFADYKVVLDWGCGSGRVARHVLPVLAPGADFSGHDIDAFAVDWANRHVGPGFHVCGLSPPLDRAAGSVDLVYAYSVLTHLAEADLRAWTAELARVLRPGGVALVTVFGVRAMIASSLPRADVETCMRTGLYDSANPQLEGIGVGGDYYRNVFMSPDFIPRAFGELFEIVDYVGCFHFHQDLLVLRRRADGTAG
jgi:SAM-dependent methyltransferase